MIPPKKELVTPTTQERRELVGYAAEQLGERLDDFLENGIVPPTIDTSAGTFGPLREGRSAGSNRTVAAVYRPSTAEREETELWHDYCSLQGYPAGELYGITEEPGNGYPPWPERSREGVWAGLSWAAIRRELLDQRAEKLRQRGGPRIRLLAVPSVGARRRKKQQLSLLDPPPKKRPRGPYEDAA